MQRPNKTRMISQKRQQTSWTQQRNPPVTSWNLRQGTVNANGSTPSLVGTVTPPPTDTVNSTFKLRKSPPHMSIPSNIVQVHSLLATLIEDQNKACDADDPTPGVSHGNQDLLADSHSVKKIPISAPQCRCDND